MLCGFLLATPVANQINQLSQVLPEAMDRIKQQIEPYTGGRQIIDLMQNPTGVFAQTGNLLAKAKTAISISIEGGVFALVILFCGFYLAA